MISHKNSNSNSNSNSNTGRHHIRRISTSPPPLGNLDFYQQEQQEPRYSNNFQPPSTFQTSPEFEYKFNPDVPFLHRNNSVTTNTPTKLDKTFDNIFEPIQFNSEMHFPPPLPLSAPMFPRFSSSTSSIGGGEPQQSQQGQNPFLSEADLREHLLLRSLEEKPYLEPDMFQSTPYNGQTTQQQPQHEQSQYYSATPQPLRYDSFNNDMSNYDRNRNSVDSNTADSYHPATMVSTPPRSSLFRRSSEGSNVVSPQPERKYLPDTFLSSSVGFPSEPEESNDSNSDENFDPSTPRDIDVLCGQSRSCASHPGNRRFQQVLDENVDAYHGSGSKQQKMQMTRAIVAKIQKGGGRFLKYDKNAEEWVEISDVLARDKVSHALRTKVASRNKRQSKPSNSANMRELYHSQQQILNR